MLGPHMVLQRDTQARVYGTATPLADITISLPLGEHNYTTTADATGVWKLDLDARPASAVGVSIALTCALKGVRTGALQVTMADVLFGDVIGCHGQSNMQFGLSNDMNATASCAEAVKYPLIRTLGANSHEDWSVPSNLVNGTTPVCEPGRFQEFSAVCWYTGRALFEKLQGTVPIGLVAAEVGGTPVEAWSGPGARKHCDQTQVVDRVGTLWASFIVPLLDMKMSAQIWYQGENNVAAPGGGGCCIIGCPLDPTPPRTPGANGCRESCQASAAKCADFYGCQFPAMITDWRTKWNGGANVSIKGRPAGPRPFVFVQLAPYTGPPTLNNRTGVSDSVALLRAAQTKALDLENVKMASAIDWGDNLSPFGCIHPRWKTPVGERAALAIAALTYGATATSEGPFVKTATAKQTTTGFDVRVVFDSKVTLVAPAQTTPPVAGITPAAARLQCEPGVESLCATFMVDGVKVAPAAVAVDDGDVVLTIVAGKGSGAAPMQVSYLQANWAVAAVWGDATPHLPAAPFYIDIIAER
jgi:sialate O-acetylesterase